MFEHTDNISSYLHWDLEGRDTVPWIASKLEQCLWANQQRAYILYMTCILNCKYARDVN